MYPTAIGSEPDHPAFDTEPLWEQVIRANGIANGTFMVAVNRTGTEGPLTFYGSSFVSDPYGRVLVQAPRDEPAVLVADLDLDQRRDWLALFPFLTHAPTRPVRPAHERGAPDREAGPRRDDGRAAERGLHRGRREPGVVRRDANPQRAGQDLEPQRRVEAEAPRRRRPPRSDRATGPRTSGVVHCRQPRNREHATRRLQRDELREVGRVAHLDHRRSPRTPSSSRARVPNPAMRSSL